MGAHVAGETGKGKKHTTQDILIVVLVGLMAIGANLPDKYSVGLDINKNFLLIGLGGFVAVALVKYLKFALVLVVAILSLGANLPRDLAEQIGVDPQLMLYALAAMVVTSFINYILKLPKGVKPLASMVYSLISAGINPNFKDEKGNLPLVLAASQGHALVVKLLLDNGAEVSMTDGAGITAAKAASKAGFSQTATLLRNAELKAQAATAAA